MTPIPSNVITELADIELDYREGLEPVTSADGRAGEYLGSGDGQIRGERVSGGVRWDLYEVIGETRCEMFFAGQIETEDGARIEFETSGYGFVHDPEHGPARWHVTAAVRFDTVDLRYAWLTATDATWHGTFDGDSYHHRYRVLVSADEAAA